MTAVAVWDHQPTAQELLDARVAQGWKPTPTDMQDGCQVLGFASRLSSGDDLSDGDGVESDSPRRAR